MGRGEGAFVEEEGSRGREVGVEVFGEGGGDGEEGWFCLWFRGRGGWAERGDWRGGVDIVHVDRMLKRCPLNGSKGQAVSQISISRTCELCCGCNGGQQG